MGWPSPPYPFGSAVSPEQMAFLDTMFNQSAAMMEIPCSVLGTNALQLAPLPNCPALTSYNELGGYRFRAIGTTTGAVTAQYNGLSVLNVYHADGVTQSTTGDIVNGQEVVLRFSQALNSGAGGFFQESPGFTPTAAAGASGQTAPGGRLTFQSGVPVMFGNQTAQQNVFYAPYIHPFIPIYNGTNVQMYNFTSGLSDQVGLTLAMAGSGSWPTNSNFDFYVTLNSGVPTLGTVAWTNNTTRATSLVVFGGFLTNGGSITLRTGAATTLAVPINQATFLGSMQTSAAGASQWVFGGSGSGGVAGSFNLSNYYNRVLFASVCKDSGAAYAYSVGTARQARASVGNQISFVSTSSERAILAIRTATQKEAGTTSFSGMGLNSTTAYVTQPNSVSFPTGVTGTDTGPWTLTQSYAFTFTGFGTVTAMETGNNTNFNANSADQLELAIWA